MQKKHPTQIFCKPVNMERGLGNKPTACRPFKNHLEFKTDQAEPATNDDATSLLADVSIDELKQLAADQFGIDTLNKNKEQLIKEIEKIKADLY